MIRMDLLFSTTVTSLNWWSRISAQEQVYNWRLTTVMSSLSASHIVSSASQKETVSDPLGNFGILNFNIILFMIIVDSLGSYKIVTSFMCDTSMPHLLKHNNH